MNDNNKKVIQIETHYTRVGRGVYNWKVVNGSIDFETSKGEFYEYVIKNGEVAGYTYSPDGRYSASNREAITYGVEGKYYDKEGKLREVVEYKAGSNRAVKQKSSKTVESVTKEKGLLDEKGEYKQSFKGGMLVAESFIYENKVVAYKWRYGQKKPLIVYTSDGKKRFELKGELTTHYGNHLLSERDSTFGEYIPTLKPDDYNFNNFMRSKNNSWTKDNTTGNWLRGEQKRNDWSFTIWYKNGKVECKGQSDNRQKVGEWIIDGKERYYILGVEVSKKLYFAKPEELDAKEVLSIENAQVRSVYIKKIGIQGIMKQMQGKQIHTEGDMELIQIPITKKDNKSSWSTGDNHMNILKVRCPSTGTYYTLRVPPDVTNCEQARQWTFGEDRPTVDNKKKEYIEFAVEA